MKARELTEPRSRSRLKVAQNSKYRILELIGQGQYGRVFCGIDRSTGQIVALKELSHHRSPTNIFLRELWSLITLEHPNIVTCQALEHTATGRVLVMDYCEGGTLRQLMEQDSALRLAEGLQLIVGILAGLDYIHQRGIIHCDIKPENILLTLDRQGWVPRLSDFGIALRMPNAQTPPASNLSVDATMGSPGYMAPERFYGLYSPASDIYAVGIILYEMLMGDRPFQGVPGKLMWAHLNQRLQLPSHIPETLRVIIQKSLEKLTARRFVNAATMAKALQQAMDDPAVKQLSDRSIPWENNSESVSQERSPESEPNILPAWIECRESANSLKNVPPFPLLDALFPLPYQAAIEPDRRWLAVVTANELHFYSLSQLQSAAAQSQALSPLRKIPFSEAILPELIFLDRRHLLAIWSDRENNQTLLRVYNRLGCMMGSYSLPAIFERDPKGRSLLLSDEPYTLFGVSSHPNRAVFRIQLIPLKVNINHCRDFQDLTSSHINKEVEGWFGS